MEKINVNLLYFAFIKEITGVKYDLVELSSDTTVKKLLDMVLEKYPSLSNRIDKIKISVNYKVVDIDTILNNGDEVALLPPVCGG
jgi:molybdopterin converting factor subunit 1